MSAASAAPAAGAGAAPEAAVSARDGVKVVARFRPLNKIELSRGGKCSTVLPGDETVNLTTQDGGSHTFSFDKVFGTTSHQEEVYESTAKPLLANLFKGYNCSLFAYGQTGSGKTHTMSGVLDDDTMKGVIPRAVEEIFRYANAADPAWEFSILVSFVEIYCERIRDLLEPKNDNLAVGEDPAAGVYIKGVTEYYVTSKDEVLNLMAQGGDNRATAATGMNAGSSRSHSLFIVTLTQKNGASGECIRGKLYLIDLAGSETVSKTGVSGQQLEELKKINKSLSALGNVINALTDGKSSHIPYRDSKLTRILQEALGGNSRTALIINCSPSSYNEQETLSTLRFGRRAKRIVNRAVVNRERSPDELKASIAALEGALLTCMRVAHAWQAAGEGASLVAAADAPANLLPGLQADTTVALTEATELLRGSERGAAMLDGLRSAGLAGAAGPGGAGPAATGASGLAGTPEDAEAGPRAGGAAADADSVVSASAELEGGGVAGAATPVEPAATPAPSAPVAWEAERGELQRERDALMSLLGEAEAEIGELRERAGALEGQVADLTALLQEAQEHLQAAGRESRQQSQPTAAMGPAAAVGPAAAEAAAAEGAAGEAAVDAALDAALPRLRHENDELKAALRHVEERLVEARAAVSAQAPSPTVAESASVRAESAGAPASAGVPAVTVYEVVWEHQKRSPLFGWGGDLGPEEPPSWAAAAPLPADASSAPAVQEELQDSLRRGGSTGVQPSPFFSGAASRLPRAKQDVSLPGKQWFWSREWMADTGGVQALADPSYEAVVVPLLPLYAQLSDGAGPLPPPGMLPAGATSAATTARRSSTGAGSLGIGPLDASLRDGEGWQYARAWADFGGAAGSAQGRRRSAAAASGEAGADGAANADSWHVRRRRWLRARTRVDIGDPSLAKQHILSLASRLEVQADELARMTSELANKQGTILDYEHRVMALTQSMAHAVATGDLRYIGQGSVGVAVGERGARIVAAPPFAGGSTAGTAPPGRSIRGGGGAGAGTSTAAPSATSSPAPLHVRSGSLGGAGPTSPHAASGSGPGSVAGDRVSTGGASGDVGDFSLFSGVRSIIKRFSSSPSKTPHPMAAAPQQHPSEAVGVARLFEACDKGDVATIEAVVRAGTVDVSVEDRAQRTPLMFAARAGCLPAVRLLVQHGADPMTCDKDGRNALHYSARRGHTEVVLWLLDEKHLSVSQTDVHALTPLHQSVLGKSPHVAALLLDRGADVNAKDANGCTPLDLALRFESKNGAALAGAAAVSPIVQLLTQRGAASSAQTSGAAAPIRSPSAADPPS